MPISQTDIDALEAQIVNPVKESTTRFQDQEFRTAQLSLEELINRRAIALQLVNGTSTKPRCSLAAFRRTDRF
jgi:hypothetical protein